MPADAPARSRGRALAVLGDLARPRSRCRRTTNTSPASGVPLKAQDLDRHRGPGLAHALAAIVRPARARGPIAAGDEDVAALQRAALHQHGRDRAAAASSLASITAPSAWRSGLALRSSSSACSRIASTSLSRPLPVLAPRPRRRARRRPSPRPRPRASAARCARGPGWRRACRSC